MAKSIVDWQWELLRVSQDRRVLNSSLYPRWWPTDTDRRAISSADEDLGKLRVMYAFIELGELVLHRVLRHFCDNVRPALQRPIGLRCLQFGRYTGNIDPQPEGNSYAFWSDFGHVRYIAG